MPAPVAAAYFHEELSGEDNDPITVVASHEGQVFRATQFRAYLQHFSGRPVELAVLSKVRLRPNRKEYDEPKLLGSVEGRTCILVDDICNTGSTIISNVGVLNKQGAGKIYAWATHGVFSETAPDHLSKLEALEYLLISNSVATNDLPDKIRVLNVAPLLAEAIARALREKNITGMLQLEPSGDLERYDA